MSLKNIFMKVRQYFCFHVYDDGVRECGYTPMTKQYYNKFQCPKCGKVITEYYDSFHDMFISSRKNLTL